MAERSYLTCNMFHSSDHTNEADEVENFHGYLPGSLSRNEVVDIFSINLIPIYVLHAISIQTS